MTRIVVIFIVVVSCFFTSACSKSSFNDSGVKKKEVRIAVVLNEKNRERWDRIMSMAQKNISEATDIRPVFDFYDEESHDIMRLAYDLAHNDSIVSVIGCEDDKLTEDLAYQMSRLQRHKPMFTFNTSEGVIRKFATLGFMWGLSESDITQSEVILSQIASRNPKSKVNIVAGKTPYASTFVDWFAFQAHELNLVPDKICVYENIDQMREYLDGFEDYTNNSVICVPSTHEEAVEMALYAPYGSYYTHKAFSPKVIETLREKSPDTNICMYGATLVADPSTGFQDIYNARYDEAPIFGEPQLYDAIMITCLAYVFAEKSGISLNSAVSALLAQNNNGQGNWTKNGIRSIYNKIVNTDEIPPINGATGRLAFFPDKHTIIQYSTYSILYMNEYQVTFIDYVNRDEGSNTSSVTSAWEWNKIVTQDFEDYIDYDVKELTGSNVIIVATSRGWDNYRHQADALAFYQHAKKSGMTDDDIILIMADDIAYNEQNPHPGTMIRTKGGENLYQNVVVDYTLDQLSPQDFRDIMLGKSSERLPVVLTSDDTKNVLLFWSGHGKPGALTWDHDDKTVNGVFMRMMLEEMLAQNAYRKFCIFIEACYSGSVAQKCEGSLPRMLIMTAANEKETSKAEYYDPQWDTYLTNSFTSSIIQTISNSEPSLNTIYHEAFKMTVGSHVTMYNASLYGNTKTNYITEYFLPESFFSGIHTE